MTDQLFQIVFSNVFISLVLAILAAVIGKTLKRPVITHLLWLLVFVKLLTPPLLTISAVPVHWLDKPATSSHFSIDEQPAMESAGLNGSSEITNLPPQKSAMALIQGKHWLLIAWGLGSMAVLIWSILQIYRFHRLLIKESEIAFPEIQAKASKIAIRLGLNAVPIIQITSANISPMVWWIGGKVWVVIPVSLIKQMDPGQFEYVLSHELAHVRRRDYMIRWIEWLVCVCFWWNPVAWWARYNLRASEELCCDALVLSSMKPKPYSYGDSLLKAIEILSFPTRHPSMIASGINNGNSLKRRVKMIISNDLIKSKLRWLQACIIFGGLIVLPLGLTSAQDTLTQKIISELDETASKEVMLQLEELQELPELFLGEIDEAIKEDDIRLTSLKQFGNTLQIEGTAPLNENIAHFMKNLENSPLFQIPELNRVVRRDTGNELVSDFQLRTILDSYPDISLEKIPREVLDKITIDDKEIPEMLTQITRTMAEAGLDVEIFLPKKTIKRDGYSEIPLHISVKGEYGNIIKAFADLRGINRFVMFQNITMRFDKNDPYVKMSMQIILYGTSNSD